MEIQFELQEQLLSLFTSLRRDQASPALKIMQKIIRNILDHPTDEKYRSLSKSSEHFTEQVWQYPSAKHFLMLVGWVDDGDSVVYDGDLEILKHAAEALDKWKGALVPQLQPSPMHMYSVNPMASAGMALGRVNLETERRLHEPDMKRQNTDKQGR